MKYCDCDVYVHTGPGHNYNSNEQDVRSVIKDIYHSISLSSYVITWLSEVGI